MMIDRVETIQVYVSDSMYTLYTDGTDTLCYSGDFFPGLISCATVATGQYIKVTGTTDFMKWFEL